MIDKKEMQRLYEAATPGPWSVYEDAPMVAAHGSKFERLGTYGKYMSESITTQQGEFCRDADASFIAAARTAIPELLAENAALQAKTAVTMGVGDGSGRLFVHGDYESIKALQSKLLAAEALQSKLLAAEALEDDAAIGRKWRENSSPSSISELLTENAALQADLEQVCRYLDCTPDNLLDVASKAHRITADCERLQARVQELESEAVQNAHSMQRLIDDHKYMVGIAERGRNAPCPNDITGAAYLLGYVQELEAKLIPPLRYPNACVSCGNTEGHDGSVCPTYLQSFDCAM